MNSPINTIPLDDQVIAVLRVYRIQSVTSFHSASDIATVLGQPTGEVVRVLRSNWEAGNLLKISRGQSYKYRLGSGAERTRGCCCCCDGKLFSAAETFCQECGPHFAGRI